MSRQLKIWQVQLWHVTTSVLVLAAVTPIAYLARAVVRGLFGDRR